MSGVGVVDGGFAIGGLVDAADIEGGSEVGLRDGDKAPICTGTCSSIKRS